MLLNQVISINHILKETISSLSLEDLAFGFLKFMLQQMVYTRAMIPYSR